jgi:hypothetical protein
MSLPPNGYVTAPCYHYTALVLSLSFISFLYPELSSFGLIIELSSLFLKTSVMIAASSSANTDGGFGSTNRQANFALANPNRPPVYNECFIDSTRELKKMQIQSQTK